MIYRFNDCTKYDSFMLVLGNLGISTEPSNDDKSPNFRFNIALTSPTPEQEAKANSYYDYLRGI